MEEEKTELSTKNKKLLLICIKNRKLSACVESYPHSR